MWSLVTVRFGFYCEYFPIAFIQQLTKAACFAHQTEQTLTNLSISFLQQGHTGSSVTANYSENPKPHPSYTAINL